jgi:hypothetical protein
MVELNGLEVSGAAEAAVSLRLNNPVNETT